MGKGRAGTMNHDYKRKGTTTLFAAMSVLDGTVIGRDMQRHRHPVFIRFLNAVEREVPAGKAVHAILDNYAAHKHPEVRKWLARHPRWTFHFTPTSASWLNAVERFFATLTTRVVFQSVVDLQAAINRFLDDHNAKSKPFRWPHRHCQGTTNGRNSRRFSGPRHEPQRNLDGHPAATSGKSLLTWITVFRDALA
jgi:transposase